MGQFKPMVKMFTDEPSVILKLKKGGKVKAAGQADGFKSMSETKSHKIFEDAESGVAPKKPSMAERQKAMNPNLYAKGGKVARKQMGGAMPVVQNPAGSNAVGVAPMQAMGRQALAGMAPAARAARAAQVRRALTGMKKGGSTSADCAKLEKELEHHMSMSASKAHGKADGGDVRTAPDGSKYSYSKAGSGTSAKIPSGKTTMPLSGDYVQRKASGGAIDAAETKTTLKNSVKPFAKTKMDTSKKDKAHGTGAVKMGSPAGYKMGGTIEGNEKQFENTKMVTSKVDRAHGTGGVKMSNAGGFKKGGKVPGLGNAIEGGNWENRPADTSKPGVTNTKTGGVKEANGGGYAKGGSAKKAYATGGNVVSDGKAEKMPRHFVSRPVANSLQSGTFKRGGKVSKFADGGDVMEDASKGAYDKSIGPDEDDMSMARAIRSVPRKLYQGAKSLLGGLSGAEKAPGAVTKTKESVTVAPAKKRGGSAKC